MPVGDDLRSPCRIRTDEQFENECAKHDEEDADADGKRHRHFEARAHAYADALVFLRTVVLRRVRRHRITEREHGHNGDGIDLLRRRIRCNGQCTEVVQRDLQDDRTDGDDGGLKRHRQPHVQMCHKDGGVRLPVREARMERRYTSPYIDPEEERTDAL